MDSRSKLVISIGLLLVVIAVGVTGYMFISGDSFIDSLYMTIITMSFAENH